MTLITNLKIAHTENSHQELIKEAKNQNKSSNSGSRKPKIANNFISPVKLSPKGKFHLNPSKISRCWSLSTTIVKSINTSNNEQTSSDKALNKVKPVRIEKRRKTNPENGNSFKYLLMTKKHSIQGNFPNGASTPKTLNWSSAISMHNDNKKENTEFNSKWMNIWKHQNFLTTPLWNSNSIFNTRKDNSQPKKITQIVTSPSNRTLLKPRKGGKKSINTDRIKLLGSKGDNSGTKKTKNYTYFTHKI